MRRVLRLGPALIALLFLFCLASLIFLNDQKSTSNYIDSLITILYLSNWAEALSIHPLDFLRHTWSLSIEEQFYIIWPFILLLLLRVLRKRYQLVIILVAIVLSSWVLRIYLFFHGATPERLYNGLDTRADALMIGCIIGVAWASNLLTENKNKEFFSKIILCAAPASATCLFAFSIFSDWSDPWMFKIGFFVIELLTAILIIDVLINENSLIKKFLGMRWLVWVGTISYGLYLWHYPIYRALFSLKISGLAVMTIGSLITFLVASISFYLIEKPILKYKKNFTREKPIIGIQPISNKLNCAKVDLTPGN